MEDKYKRTIRKEDLDIGIEYTIKGIKYNTTKCGKTIVIIIDFICEMNDLFAPKRFDSKAGDLEKKPKKLDKCMTLKAIEKKII